MAKKKAASSNKLAQFIQGKSRTSLVVMGVIFGVIVGAGGTYLTTHSFAATPACINQYTTGVGSAGTCTAIVQ